MDYLYAHNHSPSTSVQLGKLPELDPVEFESKKERRKWAGDASTKWCFYSLSYPEDTTRKPCKKSNPIQFLGGLIADYDNYDIDQELFDKALVKSKETGFPPTWAHRTPSGGFRFIWEFEQKIPFPGKKFFDLAKDLLKVDKLLPSLDKAWSNPYMLFDYGDSWVNLGPQIKNSRVLELWDQSYQKPKGFRSVDLKAVGEEAEARWPGRWKGRWEEGARGCRFWVPNADANSVILTTTGCICFTGQRSFTSWSEILGADWVERHSENNMGDILNDWIQDDTTSYYWLREEGVFRYGAEQAKLILEKSYGLNRLKVDGELSEVDEVVHGILRSRRVSAIGELPFHPPGMQRHHDRVIWNAYTTPVMQAADGDSDHIRSFFTQFFSNEKERDLFYLWVKTTYHNLICKKMQRAQVFFIVGDPNTGKNMITEKILPSIFGRGVPVGNYLVKGDSNNGSIVSSPFWHVNDVTTMGTHRDKIELMGKIKEISANTEITFKEKWRVSFVQSLAPRLMITCNETPDALSMLPTAETSALDKLIVTRVSKNAKNTFSREYLNQIFDQMPAFCGWLVQWNPPEEILSENRFGITPYFNPDLFEMALEDTPELILAGLIQMWLRGEKGIGSKKSKDPCLSSTELYQALMLRDDIRNILTGMVKSVAYFGRLLTACSKNSTMSGVVKLSRQSGTGTQKYRIVSVNEEGHVEK